ncbi:Pmp3 family protein [Acinetobacter tianfuensis]|uniref:Pmp3 family protein n=1 Tax=Acinetobacter tianfuensis TaxID=2419603 RepID=A0A3A8EDF2_9GAMM|nr:Pmp3 family protein [Acinetobacter tianfuensis]RKG32982.1 Pmp3 family protein [Acinetobacter tianfuensis]
MANKCVSCNNCGHTGWSENRGNFLITIVLAIFFVVPAIIYEIWRRTGLGVCESCGSDLVVPSNSCATNKPSDVGDLIILGVLGVAGGIVVVAIYALAGSAINAYKNRNAPEPQLSQRDLEGNCLRSGMSYYHKQGEYPILKDGKTLALDQIQKDCKGSKDGKYKAP